MSKRCLAKNRDGKRCGDDPSDNVAGINGGRLTRLSPPSSYYKSLWQAGVYAALVSG